MLSLLLGLGRSPPDPSAVYFHARTLADPGGRRTLECLVCPDPPVHGRCLASIPPSSWRGFGDLVRQGGGLRLRWKAADGREVDTPLEKVLPWARPDLREDRGLLLGGHRDESGNPLLPPDDWPIQIGVRMP